MAVVANLQTTDGGRTKASDGDLDRTIRGKGGSDPLEFWHALSIKGCDSAPDKPKSTTCKMHLLLLIAFWQSVVPKRDGKRGILMWWIDKFYLSTLPC